MLSNSENLKCYDVLNITMFLFKFNTDYFEKIEKIPVVLENLGIENSTNNKIIVPENFFPDYNWGLLFDRHKSLKIIHSEYPKEIIEIFVRNNIVSKYPDFPSNLISGTDYRSRAKTEEGKKLFDECCDSSSKSRISDIEVIEYFLPDKLNNIKISQQISDIIFDLFRIYELNRGAINGFYNLGSYFNREDYNTSGQSEIYYFFENKKWIYTSKNNFENPSSVFCLDSYDYEIFKNFLHVIPKNRSYRILEYMGMKNQVPISVSFQIIETISNSKDISRPEILKIYDWLTKKEESSLIQAISNLEPDTKIIFYRGKFYSPSDCVWDGIQDESGKNNQVVLSDEYGKEYEKFFVLLGVSKSYDLLFYLEKWKDIIHSKSVNKSRMDWILNNVKLKLNALNQSLIEHIEKSDYDDEIKSLTSVDFIYSINENQFFDPSEIYFPDSELTKDFEERIPFVYFPESDGFEAWKDFFNELGVNNASDFIKTSLEQHSKNLFQKVEENKYLTKSSLILIGAFLKTKYSNHYEQLFESGFCEKLLNSKELTCKEDFSIHLSFESDKYDETVYSKNSVHFDSNKFHLYYSSHVEKDEIAKEIYNLLKDNIPGLEDCRSKIENFLGISKFEKRINKEGYTLPIELLKIESINDLDSEEFEQDEEELENDFHQKENIKRVEAEVYRNKKSNQQFEPSVKSDDGDNTGREFPPNLPSLEAKIIEPTEIEIRKNALKFDIANSGKYSFKRFKKLLELECLINDEKETKNQGLSMYFNEYLIEDDRFLILKRPNRPISLSIENQEDISIYFTLKNGNTVLVHCNSASIKSFTVHLKFGEDEKKKINEIRTNSVNEIRLEVSKQLRIDVEFKKAFSSLNFKDDLCLKNELKNKDIKFIFGPPGTGKTTTLANLIKENFEKKRKSKSFDKILVLTTTNKAADVLTLKLLDKIEDGDKSWIWRFVSTHDSRIESEGVLKSRDAKIQNSEKACVISTMARFPYDGFNEIPLKKVSWDLIIIDEASMIPIAHVLYSLNVNLKHKAKFIIAGDPFQIGPIVNVDELKDENIYTMVNLNSFSKPSTSPHFKVDCLKTQYRAIPSIGKLFSDYVYNGVLEHHRKSESQKKLTISFPVNDINFLLFPVNNSTLFAAKSIEKSNVHLYSALYTFELLAKINSDLLHSKQKEKWSIGVISPYRRQVEIVNKLWESRGFESEMIDVSIGTVHGFQGDECDIIIALYNPPSAGLILNPENVFVNNTNILNVAISRARDYLFVVMPDEDYIHYDNLYELNKLKEIAMNNPKKIATHYAKDLEITIFNKENFIEESTFVSMHQKTNVYSTSKFKYDIRIDRDAVDILINT
jgi:flagellar biosynthesis GTPase FlhF